MKLRPIGLAPPLLLAALCLHAPTQAQSPDGRGEVVTLEPEYQGVRANAPIPPGQHVRNEGGSDGAGLCVIASILANGEYQRVPGLESGKGSLLWRTAKGRPGGYYPEKLEALIKETLPGEKWFSWEGEGTDLVEEYSRRGYPVAATTNTGALYGYQSIHHMISNAHLDAEWACVVDNNDPGRYHWMPRAEFDRRFRDGPKGWGFVWLRKPDATTLAVLCAAALLAASAFLIAFGADAGPFDLSAASSA